MDKKIISDLDNFPEEDKQRMSTIVDQLQFRDSLRMYNSVVERCFNECVNAFYRKSLTKQEETCVLRCAQKFLRLSTQVGLRFSDLTQEASTTDKVHIIAGAESKIDS
ncbi:Mitochondrial import inner membrane translocase subunit Tim9 [Vigna angularis]|uniref:Mitochondrial import inner membrane translocase subunit n=1 Tax=Phaseolus angularis TaxID=3914 RepID=A0A8T0JRR5_PHAAN|nr:mitochondrial import inner membrane translocase subunit Tim9 [Vigna angularis]KAG2380862.1 Mitochondrial import inner membrane translocase subunit Tim9 [Vigna angularis]